MKTTNSFFAVFCLILAVLSFSGFRSGRESGMNTSEPGSLTVTTQNVLDIKSNRASCTFTITGSPVQEKGVCFSQSPNPTISNSKSMAPSNPTNSGKAILSGLKPSTKYYVRAYAKSGSNVFYGNELSFTTTNDEQKSNSNFGQKIESNTGGSK